jgi:hypothetical protein
MSTIQYPAFANLDAIVVLPEPGMPHKITFLFAILSVVCGCAIQYFDILMENNIDSKNNIGRFNLKNNAKFAIDIFPDDYLCH